MTDVRTLVHEATRAAGEGRWQVAEQTWARVLAIDPKHPQALYSVGVHAFQRGQLGDALRAFQAADAAAPGDPVVLLSISRVFSEQGDPTAAGRAVDASLAVDPYFLPGLLAKASLLEQAGQSRGAVTVYRNALKVAPPQPQWPPALRSQLERAHRMTERYGTSLAAFLAEQAGTRIQALTTGEAERWREAGAIVGGQSQPYQAGGNQLHVPRLPAIPFFERAQFEWVEAVEAETDAITGELYAARAGDRDDFQPYVAYAPGTPVNQWQELNHSSRWSGYKLWDNGVPIAEHLDRCPKTADALKAVGQPDIPGMCPNAMFSALAPHTRIPPHQGDTNARLVVHLPLVVPEGCLYRVGFERRRWNVGEVLIFDDSIEHEARNDSDELRVILIFDVWNPLLSEAEREMVRFVTSATREFVFDPGPG